MNIVEALKDLKGRDQLASLWGISAQRMITNSQRKDWVVSRKNHGMKMIHIMKDIFLAR
jgi:hypothetical protein